MLTRRSIFSSVAAGLAAAGVPAGAKAGTETKEITPGLFALEVPHLISASTYNFLAKQLEPVEREFNIKFLILVGGAKIRPVSPTAERKIVRVLDAHCGDRGKVFVAGEEIADCVRAEMYDDGRGTAWFNIKDADGRYLIASDGAHVMRGNVTGDIQIDIHSSGQDLAHGGTVELGTPYMVGE